MKWKWKCEVEIAKDIDFVWEVLLSRAVLSDGVVSSRLIEIAGNGLVFEECYAVDESDERYFITMSVVSNYGEYKVIHSNYVLNNVYVVNEYFELLTFGDVTVVKYYGRISSYGFKAFMKLMFRGLFNGSCKYNKFCQRVKEFCE
jgi:hypothetical protein